MKVWSCENDSLFWKNESKKHFRNSLIRWNESLKEKNV